MPGRFAKPPKRLGLLACAALLAMLASACGGPVAAADAPPEVVALWPGQPPGTESWSGAEEEADAELAGIGKVHVITNVTRPTLTVFRPPAGKANGTAMVVVPGGAFRALPWDLDGTETAEWLTAHGVTAFVLKYRVRPPQPSQPNAAESFDHFATRTAPARAIAAADAGQAVRLVRAQAKRFGLAPHRIGMIGFSAGAMTVLGAAADRDPKARPDFAAALYGALLDGKVPPKDAPPLFIVAAQDDPQVPPARATQMFDAWTAAGAPAELHVYEAGGHGFGFRPHGRPADRWPEAFAAWLASRGLIAKR